MPFIVGRDITSQERLICSRRRLASKRRTSKMLYHLLLVSFRTRYVCHAGHVRWNQRSGVSYEELASYVFAAPTHADDYYVFVAHPHSVIWLCSAQPIYFRVIIASRDYSFPFDWIFSVYLP